MAAEGDGGTGGMGLKDQQLQSMKDTLIIETSELLGVSGRVYGVSGRVYGMSGRVYRWVYGIRGGYSIPAADYYLSLFRYHCLWLKRCYVIMVRLVGVAIFV